MLKLSFLTAAPWACAWLAFMPPAQAADEKNIAEPARPAMATPFDTYQPWREEPLRDWREVNDRVGEIGGWRTYLRESSENSDPANGSHGHHGH